MSKVAIQGAATGTGVFTLASPATNTNRTLTIPDVDGTIVTSDASGNVGIGTSSPAYKLDVSGQGRFSTGITLSAATSSLYSVDGALSYYASGNGVYLNGTNSGWLALQASGSQSTYINLYGTASGSNPNIIQFATAGSERMRIDSSGNLLVNRTTQFLDGQYSSDFNGNSKRGATYNNTFGSGANFISFGSAGTQIGTIQQNGGSNVSYITSSDYRLKENVQPMRGALAKVSALSPCTFRWKIDGSDGQGFIAHELQEVCPDAVSGEKDAVNEDGSIKPQGVDTSFLVATLTAAIQEQQAIIESLTARVVALEGQP